MKFLTGPTLAFLFVSTSVIAAAPVDRVLERENKQFGVTVEAQPLVDDLTYLRRVSIDLIGRIPTSGEIDEYLSWPASKRRQQVVEKLINDEHFADRWTVFFGDMLRLRSNVTGGSALIAFIHNSINNDLPYDELARRLISTNGKANKTPEVGYILGDNVDPYALASVTSQVFMGIRIGCAQCHDHPFDVWTREDFYGMAAYFGKTRRIQSNLTNVIYTTEDSRSVVMWPPQDDLEASNRKAKQPAFPFKMIPGNKKPDFIVRLDKLRTELARQQAGTGGPSVDDLLAEGATKARNRAKGRSPDALDVTGEAKTNLRRIDIKGSLYRHSKDRLELARLVTSPRNPYFGRAFVNRLWKELIGRGFVEPIDDFRQDNPASHPETLAHLSEEFVAGGYNFRQLVMTIVSSDIYQRSRVPNGTEELTRQRLEHTFLAAPMRRMISESLYDSIVTAGHLFEYKYPKGANSRIITEQVRVMISAGSLVPEDPSLVDQLTKPRKGMKPKLMDNAGYDLEAAIELDFKALLNQDDEEVGIERMQVMSKEELEAQRMLAEQRMIRSGAKYETRTVKREVDLNPRFNSSLRMASPAPAGHFVRVFGQTSRADLGTPRQQDPTMRQALMMLNGRLTHEASRVGSLEPIARLLEGNTPDIPAAIRLAYREILTRDPSSDEIHDATEIIQGATTPLDGMADLRWVLLNCNEFRFLP
jgi:hypothetical protein